MGYTIEGAIEDNASAHALKIRAGRDITGDLLP